MTTLTKDEIIALSKQAGFAGWKCDEEKIVAFAHLCRADLEADLEKHRALLLQHLAVIDPLRAEVERLNAFVDAAFVAHPNLDLDVECVLGETK
jgi:hypothetical protein